MDDDFFDDLLTTKTMDDKLQFRISLFSSVPHKAQVTNALSTVLYTFSKVQVAEELIGHM